MEKEEEELRQAHAENPYKILSESLTSPLPSFNETNSNTTPIDKITVPDLTQGGKSLSNASIQSILSNTFAAQVQSLGEYMTSYLDFQAAQLESRVALVEVKLPEAKAYIKASQDAKKKK